MKMESKSRRDIGTIVRMFREKVAHIYRRLAIANSEPDGELIRKFRRARSEDIDEQERFETAELLAAAVYPKYKFSEFGRTFLEDQCFLKYYQNFMDPGNWHSLDRKYVLNELLKQALLVEGDAAEAGVYKGASSYLICKAIAGLGRQHHLFDSFEGLSVPDFHDGDYWTKGALSASEEDVRRSLSEFSNYTIYKGWIPECFTDVANCKFSFVHIDVDLYGPTKQSLEFFYPRLTQGAIVLLDDVGFKTCPGATKAANEVFGSCPEPLMFLPTGQGFAIKC